MNFTKNTNKIIDNLINSNVSISNLLDTNISRSFSVKKFLKHHYNLYIQTWNDESRNNRIRAVWKSYCIPTNIGYWVPHFYVDKVDSSIEHRRQRIANIEDILNHVFNSETEKKLEEVFINIQEKLKNLSKNMDITMDWKYSRAMESWRRWRKRIKRLAYKDGDRTIRDTFIDKIVGIEKTKLFDFFVSSIHTNDFINSIFDFF